MITRERTGQAKPMMQSKKVKRKVLKIQTNEIRETLPKQKGNCLLNRVEKIYEKKKKRERVLFYI